MNEKIANYNDILEEHLDNSHIIHYCWFGGVENPQSSKSVLPHGNYICPIIE